MIRIVVCDDDVYTLKISEFLINEALEQNNIEGQIECSCRNYAELREYLKKNPGDYLFFMDLDFGSNNLNGIDMSKYIKSEGNSKIVFVSSYSDMAMEIIKSGVEPFGFIEKDIDQNKMTREYGKYIQMMKKIIDNSTCRDENQHIEQKDRRCNSIQLPIGIDEYIEIETNQILYVESVKSVAHNICYHTIDGSKIMVRDTIQNALDKLGGDFEKSHRSVIVNKTQVIGAEDGLLKLSNGELVSCAAIRLKDILKKN